VVDVVAVDVVGARRSCSGRGRRGHGRRGRSSVELLGTWSTWSELGGAARDMVWWSEGFVVTRRVDVKSHQVVNEGRRDQPAVLKTNRRSW